MKEDWKRDFEWLQLRHAIKDRFNRAELPNLEAVLYLVGMQEFGYLQSSFSKEEKQDLMHVAICRLFEEDGYFEWVGRDGDGWPHYKQMRNFSPVSLITQEQLIINKLTEYFSEFLTSTINDHEE